MRPIAASMVRVCAEGMSLSRRGSWLLYASGEGHLVAIESRSRQVFNLAGGAAAPTGRPHGSEGQGLGDRYLGLAGLRRCLGRVRDLARDLDDVAVRVVDPELALGAVPAPKDLRDTLELSL